MNSNNDNSDNSNNSNNSFNKCIDVDFIRVEFKDLTSELICPICLGLVYDPVCCRKCHAPFGRSCIQKWFRSNKSNKCPNKCEFEEETMPLIFTKLINKIKLKCVNSECKEVISYDKFYLHLEICPFGMFKCYAIGCNYKGNRENIKKHLDTCNKLFEICKYCKGKFKKEDFDSHQSNKDECFNRIMMENQKLINELEEIKSNSFMNNHSIDRDRSTISERPENNYKNNNKIETPITEKGTMVFEFINSPIVKKNDYDNNKLTNRKFDNSDDISNINNINDFNDINDIQNLVTLSNESFNNSNINNINSNNFNNNNTTTKKNKHNTNNITSNLSISKIGHDNNRSMSILSPETIKKYDKKRSKIIQESELFVNEEEIDKVKQRVPMKNSKMSLKLLSQYEGIKDTVSTTTSNTNNYNNGYNKIKNNKSDIDISTKSVSNTSNNNLNSVKLNLNNKILKSDTKTLRKETSTSFISGISKKSHKEIELPAKRLSKLTLHMLNENGSVEYAPLVVKKSENFDKFEDINGFNELIKMERMDSKVEKVEKVDKKKGKSGKENTKTEDKKEQEVRPLSNKEIKELARPEFESKPEKFYPTVIFDKLGFKRARCPKCKHYFWRRLETTTLCGDSNCTGLYGFIGKGTSKSKTKITYSEAWKGYERSLTTSRIPSTSIDRYPVVARWRTDVEFVAAGIYCFQPYCVTGELDPPANPLICPQFAVRFNDLDNIGITGRHYSGFIMLGLQVFNLPDKYVFFKEECVEFNYRWLTEELMINPDEITFVEDIWVGGGNLGPSIEYFIGGLELGNMVFMQYKTFHDGTREELPVKVIDVGIGLERVAWLLNGSATSYVDTFRNALGFLTDKLNMKINDDIWEKFGPYSCMLDVDESADLDKTWKEISEKIGIEEKKIKEAMSPVRDLYIILDHTRTILMIIYDGYLPGNVGGGSNIRNIIRRVFAILQNNGWWDILKLDGLIELLEYHKKDLEEIYGKFNNTDNIREVLRLEKVKWETTDKDAKTKLDKLLKDKKNVLSIDDWIYCIGTWGIPADKISQISKIPIPNNLYMEIENRNFIASCKKAENILYDTSHLKETDSLFYQSGIESHNFRGKIVDVFTNMTDKNNLRQDIVILDRTSFYPTSGGQEHDTGVLTIKGETYNVVNAEKVGKCVLHFLDKEIVGNKKDWIGVEVTGAVDQARRRQLMAHHTGTHIVFAACKKVLGSHVWQNGAKKTTQNAHLDITHYQPLTYEEEQKIEQEANRIILEGTAITKSFKNKSEAEKEYGFTLYQGGIVPGNSLRIVNIENTDVEACCGTHFDNTSEVGFIKLQKTHKISDGIVRLYYVANAKAFEEQNYESQIIHQLSVEWGGIEKNMITKTGARFFNESKQYYTELKKQEQLNLSLQMKLLFMCDKSLAMVKTELDNPTLYFSALNEYFEKLKNLKKGMIFYNSEFVHLALGSATLIDTDLLTKFIEGAKDSKTTIKTQIKNQIGGKTGKVSDILSYTCFYSKFNTEKLVSYLTSCGVEIFDLDK